MASLVALPVGAQEKGTKETKAAGTVPQSAQPPAGLCRVWLENVPASQQPAPTDCATAIRNRPNNAHIVFGDLSREAAKPPLRSSAVQPGQPGQPGQSDQPNPPSQRGWQNRLTDPPRRFDTGPGIPNHRAESRQSEARQNEGVRPVSATAPGRPSSDSGPKRRP